MGIAQARQGRMEAGWLRAQQKTGATRAIGPGLGHRDRAVAGHRAVRVLRYCFCFQFVTDVLFFARKIFRS
jgi:hypothetical protein